MPPRERKGRRTASRQEGVHGKQFPPVVAFVLAGGLFGLAGLLDLVFWNLERNGGSMHLHASIVALYRLGGKVLVSGALGILGCLFLTIGLLEVARDRRSENEDEG